MYGSAAMKKAIRLKHLEREKNCVWIFRQYFGTGKSHWSKSQVKNFFKCSQWLISKIQKLTRKWQGFTWRYFYVDYEKLSVGQTILFSAWNIINSIRDALKAFNVFVKKQNTSLKKIPSGKTNIIKNALLFLSRTRTHRSFIFSLEFLYELKYKPLWDFPFLIPFVLIKAYIFAQQKAWTLWI